ncbi:flavin reductase family protein [Asaia platycodi]|uniref:flavin reductase family protein n=1 Tax=Asaia platycodi TaxID=610243 RepID=UPI0034E2B033
MPERPPLSKEIFRDAMARLASAVTIITTDGENGRHGFTASAVCSVSDDPATLLVCVNRTASSHAHLVRHGLLAINILAHEQERSQRYSVAHATIWKRVSRPGSGARVKSVCRCSRGLWCRSNAVSADTGDRYSQRFLRRTALCRVYP